MGENEFTDREVLLLRLLCKPRAKLDLFPGGKGEYETIKISSEGEEQRFDDEESLLAFKNLKHLCLVSNEGGIVYTLTPDGRSIAKNLPEQPKE